MAARCYPPFQVSTGSVRAMSAVDVRSLPWSWYTDPAVLQLERERIFRRSWQYVGHTGDVPEPGSFAATRVGDIPVVLVRDREDTLRAFLNVCRHRGSIVCEGAGRRETLQCPYHAWTYGLDGRLITAPRGNSEGGIEKDELGLLPLQLDTWGPLIFVNPDMDAGPLDDSSTGYRSGSPTRVSTWTLCGSCSARSRSSPATGRSPRRTSSSATTARLRTLDSPP